MAEGNVSRVKKKRGFATYFSWVTKIISIVYAILMSIFTERSAVDISIISGIIFGSGLPIDASKIIAAVRQPMDKEG